MDDIKLIHVITDETRFNLLQLLMQHHFLCKSSFQKLVSVSLPSHNRFVS